MKKRNATGGVVIVTNMPTHYRAPVFDRLPAGEYQVIYCSRVEPNRQWTPPTLRHHATFLGENHAPRPDGVSYVHDNRDIWKALGVMRPRVVVIGGLNPTHIYAFAWALAHGARVVYMTDGTLSSEAHLGLAHRLMRRIVLPLCRAFVVAGSGGAALMRAYRAREAEIFVSPLCASPATRPVVAREHRVYDVMFCGRLHVAKMPGFFIDVCARIARRRGHCRALVVGDGPEAASMRASAEAAGLQVTWAGFVQPEDIERHYASAALLLFPTRCDPWGMVANEAMAVGTPVITMPTAGCAGDLVRDRVDGRVLPADADAWAQAACELLDDQARWSAHSLAAREQSMRFSYAAAVAGLIAACTHAATG